MNPSEIKRLRTQSVLKELLPEALSTLCLRNKSK